MGVRGLWIVSLALLCSACSVIKDSKEMKNTLGDLNGKGDQIAKRISDVEQEGTFERAYSKFIEETERLFGENGKTGASPEDDLSCDPDLVIYAQAALQSLLFQFWKGDYHDTMEALDNRYALHMDTFYARLNKPINHEYIVDVLNPTRAYKGVGMLGAFLETVRPEYEAALKRAGLPRLSVYDVTLMALKNRDGGAKTLLPKTQAKVLQWKQEAIQVLQLRHNFLPLLVLARMSDLQTREDFRLFGLRLPISKLMMILKGYRLNLNDRDPQLKIDDEQLILWTNWLNSALETRQALREIGIEPKYNRTMASLLKSLNFGQSEILARKVAVQDRRAQLEQAFAAAYEKTVSEMPARF